MIAGKGLPRVLGLVARCGDVWASSRLSADEFRERSQALDVQLERSRRAPESVQRAGMDIVVCWRDEAELERRVRVFRQLFPTQFANLTPIETRDALRKFVGRMIDGTPAEVVDQIRAYDAAGMDELMIDWFDCDDLEGLHVLADEILPEFARPVLERV